MDRTVVLGFSALAGAVLIAFWASDFLYGMTMGAVLGLSVAVAAYAFPMDLDYRERRVWPPREP